MKVSDILEKWDEEAKINHEKKGMFDGKTLVQLEHELAALKKAGPHPQDSPGFTKMKQLEFCIRARKAKGGKWAGVDTDKTADHKPTEVMSESLDPDEIKIAQAVDHAFTELHMGEPEAYEYVARKFGIGNPQYVQDCYEDWLNAPVSEAKEWKVKHTGRNTNKSVAKLKSERSKAKKRHDTKAVKQKNFAIRAKTGWGKAK